MTGNTLVGYFTDLLDNLSSVFHISDISNMFSSLFGVSEAAAFSNALLTFALLAGMWFFLKKVISIL